MTESSSRETVSSDVAKDHYGTLDGRGRAESVWQSWFPKALVYREWRIHRGALVLAWALMCAPFLVPLIFAGPYWGSATMEAFLYRFVDNQLYSSAGVSYFSFLAVVSGVSLVWHDRARAGFLYAITGPVARRDVLRVKALYGMGLVLLSFIPCGLILTLFYSTATGNSQLGPVMLETIGMAVAQAATIMTGMAVAVVCTNLIMAVIGAYLVIGVPMYLSSLLTFFDSPSFTGQPFGAPYNPFVAHTSFYLKEMSPIGGYGYIHLGWLTPLFFLWFVAWVMGFWVLARNWMDTSPLERMSETFVFPKLWYAVLIPVCFVAATILGHMLAHGHGSVLYVIWFVIIYILAWSLIRRLALRHVQREKVGA